MKKIIHTDKAPAAIGPYSQAVVHNGTAYVSGLGPMDPDTRRLVEGDIAAQTERTLENLALVLAACGSSLDNVLKTTVYLKDMNDFARMNEVYGRFFADGRPARATIQAARLPLDILVEIDAIAAVD